MHNSKKVNKIDVDLIFIDLDHTLIGVGKPPVGEINESAILEATKEGKTVSLCTGRNLEDSIIYAEKLKLKHHICFGGAIIYDVIQKKIIPFDSFFSADLTTLIEKKIFQKSEAFVTFHTLDLEKQKMIHFSYGEENKHFTDHKIINNNYNHVQDLNKVNKYKVFKINIFAKPKEVEKLVYEIEKATNLNVIANYPEIVEITKNNINKGAAAKQLAKHLNIDFQKSLAFGDSHNDVSLFKIIKYGIAVANAVDALKKIAFSETANYAEQGVGKAIYKWVLKNQK